MWKEVNKPIFSRLGTVRNIKLSLTPVLNRILQKLSEEMEQWRRRYRENIFVLVSQYEPLPAKTFPGRAAIMVKLLELSRGHVAAVYEQKGSQKTCRYVPGTRIPILQEWELYR